MISSNYGLQENAYDTLVLAKCGSNWIDGIKMMKRGEAKVIGSSQKHWTHIETFATIKHKWCQIPI